MIVGMRFIKADCEVQYDGRGATTRGRGERVILVKDDDTVLVHAATKVKPLNYMTKTRSVSETVEPDGTSVLTVSSSKETIRIVMYEKMIDLSFPMRSDDSVSIVNGTERQLQEWLTHPDVFPTVFGGDMRYLVRELGVDTGSIDIAGYYPGTDGIVAIEVKRRAMPNDVYQVLRYRESLEREDRGIREGRMGIPDTVIARFRNDARILMENPGALSPMDRERAGLLDGVQPSALGNIECWLVAETGSQAVADACEAHGVHYVEVGKEWRAQSIDAGEAARPRTKLNRIMGNGTSARQDNTLFTDNQQRQ